MMVTPALVVVVVHTCRRCACIGSRDAQISQVERRTWFPVVGGHDALLFYKEKEQVLDTHLPRNDVVVCMCGLLPPVRGHLASFFLRDMVPTARSRSFQDHVDQSTQTRSLPVVDKRLPKNNVEVAWSKIQGREGTVQNKIE